MGLKNYPNKKKVFIFLKILYLTLLILGVFYVRDTLRTEAFTVVQKDKERKPEVKIKDVKVNLIVDTGKEKKEYQTKLRNIDSVMDLLKDLRKTQGFYFEYDIYSYGIELINVLGVNSTDSKRWVVFKDGQDITNFINNHKIGNNGVYEIKLLEK